MPSLPQRLKGETSAEFCKRVAIEPRVKKSRLPKKEKEKEKEKEEEKEKEKEEEKEEESATPKKD